MSTRFQLAMLVLASALAAGPAAEAAQACPNLGFTVVEAKASPDTRPVRGGQGQVLQVRREAITTTADIARLRVEDSDVGARLLVNFRPEAAARLEQATTNHSGLRLAFVADDEALLAVTWEGEYGMGSDGSQISLRDRARAYQLADALRGCIGEAP